MLTTKRWGTDFGHSMKRGAATTTAIKINPVAGSAAESRPSTAASRTNAAVSKARMRLLRLPTPLNARDIVVIMADPR
jgi:hypothetical protein